MSRRVIEHGDPIRTMKTIGRNSPCVCGSGQKYKRCCGRSGIKQRAQTALSPVTAAAWQTAISHTQAGRLLEAQITCSEILLSEPDNVMALSLSAGLALRLGKPRVALERMQRAVELQPRNASYRCTLGEALEGSKRPADAIREFLAAWRLAPEQPGAYDRLIVTCMREGRLEEGVGYFREALARDPQLRDSCSHLDPALARISVPADARSAAGTDLPIDPLVLVACYAYGRAADRLGNVPESSRACRNREILDPSCGAVYFSLFHILCQRGRFNEALACVRAVAALEPQNATAHHLIAALSGESLDRASPQYCESLFDDYAARFDAHLVNRLGYAAPQKLAELALAIAQPPPSGWDILDLGCGTGLVGVAFTSVARSLVGVDLSGAMLEHTKKRQLYSRLEKTDVEDFLHSGVDSSYDVIVAADVFTYLGRLDSVFEDMKRVLRIHGLAAFSVEALESASIASPNSSADYALTRAGRFAQSHSYVERLSANYGLVIETCVETILRTEHGSPSPGRLYVVRLRSSVSPRMTQKGTRVTMYHNPSGGTSSTSCAHSA